MCGLFDLELSNISQFSSASTSGYIYIIIVNSKFPWPSGPAGNSKHETCIIQARMHVNACIMHGSPFASMDHAWISLFMHARIMHGFPFPFTEHSQVHAWISASCTSLDPFSRTDPRTKLVNTHKSCNQTMSTSYKTLM